MRQYRQRGFTLIELLVVVSIIGLLSSIVFTFLNTARVKARNAARNAAIEQLRTAIFIGIGTDSLPSTNGTYACVSFNCYGGFNVYGPNATVDAVLAGNIQKPDDPADGGRSGFRGYLYFDPATWVGNLPTFPPGHYLNWLLEPVPITSTVCGPGQYYSATSNLVQCLLRLD